MICIYIFSTLLLSLLLSLFPSLFVSLHCIFFASFLSCLPCFSLYCFIYSLVDLFSSAVFHFFLASMFLSVYWSVLSFFFKCLSIWLALFWASCLCIVSVLMFTRICIFIFFLFVLSLNEFLFCLCLLCLFRLVYTYFSLPLMFCTHLLFIPYSICIHLVFLVVVLARIKPWCQCTCVTTPWH